MTKPDVFYYFSKFATVIDVFTAGTIGWIGAILGLVGTILGAIGHKNQAKCALPVDLYVLSSVLY